MRVLGMIGGTSWHSTVIYYQTINRLVGERKGTHLNPPLVLYSLNVELMRTGDREKINAAYLDISNKLIDAGAEAIIICANTPHMVYDFVSPKISVPILHIADAIAEDAKNRQISNLGLLGTRPTMKGDFISGPLRTRHSIDTLVPTVEDQGHVHALISEELTQGKFTDDARSFTRKEMDKLKSRGADGMILGCTELPMLLSADDYDLPMIDTTYVHAKMAVDFILGK